SALCRFPGGYSWHGHKVHLIVIDWYIREIGQLEHANRAGNCMDFVRLRTLPALALRNTRAAVADALRISPSAVSQQIAQLEDELQVELVERRGRGVLLTPVGKRLIAHVERLT